MRPAIRFINLDRAGERRAFMERQAVLLGLSIERVRALKPNDVDPDELARLAASWQRPMTAGEVACFLSHRSQWRRVAEEKRPALILEDDAVLSARLPAVLEAALEMQDTGLLTLESYDRCRFLRDGDTRDLGGGVRAVRCLRDKAGAAAYLLWPGGAQHLLKRTDGRAGLADAELHGTRLTAYVCEPALAVQLSTLERLGHRGEIDGQSLLQRPRDAAPTTVRQRLRRVAAQIELAPFHLSRLTGTAYRRVRLDPDDFRLSPDQTRS